MPFSPQTAASVGLTGPSAATTFDNGNVNPTGFNIQDYYKQLATLMQPATYTQPALQGAAAINTAANAFTPGIEHATTTAYNMAAGALTPIQQAATNAYNAAAALIPNPSASVNAKSGFNFGN